MKTNLIDYIDFDRINTLLEGFNKTTGFVTAILDLEGNILSKSGWRSICTDFHRSNAATAKRCTISDTLLAGKMADGEKYHFYKCLNGLVDVAVPLVINGEHIANLFSGQFFFEEPDRDFFLKQAEKYGFDEEKYLEALNKTPVVSEERVQIAMDFLLNMTQLISEMTFQKLEQAELNQKLKESERTFRKLFEDSFDANLLLDEQNVFVECNQAALDLLKMTREQFLYLKPEDISPEIQPNGKSSKEAALEMIEIANKNGHNRFDWTHVDAEGREFIVDISLMPVVIKGRKMLHTIWRDITESIQAEEENRVLADIIRKSGDFIGVADPDGRAIFVNPAGKAMMGFDEEFEEAKTVVEDYFFPEDMEIVRNEILPTVMKKGRWAGEFRFRHFKTGEPVYVYYDLFLTSDPSTGKVQNLSTVTRDITELKRAEKALQKSEASFKSMFEKHGAIMLIIEPETGLIIDANDMASDFYGYSKAMLCSMTINDINILSHEEVLCELKAALNEKRNFFIFPHKLANGKIRTVEVHSTPIDFEQRRVLFSIIHDVTERIQAQQALKESEEKMRSIYRVAPTGIGVVVNRVLKEVNPRVCKMTGYSRTELLGNNALMLYPSQEEYELVGKEKYNQISEHGTGEVETRWKKKDGTIINVLLASTPIELNDLSKGVTFTALDITERKRIEAKLIIAKEKAERNENELKKAQKIAHLGSWYLDLETNQVVWTEELYKMYGFDPALPVPPYTEHMKLFTPESWELLSNSLAKTAETNIPYELELKTVKNDGSNGWMWVRGETVSDAEGRTIGLWGAAQDITEHKQTELLLQEKTEEIEVRNEELMDNIAAYAALNEEYATQNEELQSAIEKVEESEAKFREMAELLPQIVFESDLQGYLTYVNKQAYNLTGYSEQDGLIGKSTLSFYILEDRERAIENMKLSLTGNKQAASNEYTMMGKDGSHFNVLVYSNPIVKDNRVVGLRGIIVDITELKRTEKELVKAKERAEESDRLKSAFLANMSHEIRTPMNGILGFAELLKEPNLSGEEQKRFIGIIEKSGARMLNIINDIVSISKIEAGLMEVNRQDSNVNEQIEYIYTFFKPEVESKGMQLSFKNPLPANEAILKTDREKVYAILTNLVKNAIKYSNQGFIEFGYSLKKNAEHSELEFFVKDTGIGIPKDRQQAIFERFVQADIADKNALQGAGLGLSISKAYVEMLGGKMWVESEVGTGSTFFFTIPYHNGIAKEKKPVNEILPALETATMRKLKVLIAEDDMPSEILISMAVKKLGYDIICVRTGTEAVEVCRKNPDIDLVLMDILLPGLDGYEATKQIRKFNSDIYIIAQTAYAMEGDRKKALSAGCNDYIAKPIKLDALKQMITEHFSQEK